MTLEALLARLQGVAETTPGFFRSTAQAFTDELQGGADAGKLERILETFSANQRAIQAMTSRADLADREILHIPDPSKPLDPEMEARAALCYTRGEPLPADVREALEADTARLLRKAAGR